MGLFRRRVRGINELMADPEFPYMIGRMVGAAEMAAYWMELQDEPQTQSMGKRLHGVTAWFLDDEPVPTGSVPATLGVPGDEH